MPRVNPASPSDPPHAPECALTLRGTLAYIGHADTEATVVILRRDTRERFARAFGAWAALWALAVLGVFVPVGHWLLVPGFGLAGPVVGLLRWHERVTVLSASGPCPACGRPQAVRLGHPASAEMAIRCADCGRELRLRPGSETAPA